MGPSDVILEPKEKVLLATRPLFLWEPLVILDIGLIVLSLLFTPTAPPLAVAAGAAFVLLTVWIIVKWVPWNAKWFVLTDRRVIARWGVFNRNQTALLLDRIQDASLARPFPLSLVRDYGVLRLESAGEHASERISGGMTGGPQELAMTGATGFYRALTDAQTPN
jgi:PH (Pleckstrin Homology) domain-containing protein